MKLRNVSGGTFSETVGGSLRHFHDGAEFEVPDERAKTLLGITPAIVVRVEAPSGQGPSPDAGDGPKVGKVKKKVP